MDTIELAINDVVYGGRGLGRLDGCVVFVPGVIPGETVRAEITKRHKNYIEARLMEVLAPSPLRIQPACPLAGMCPGCCYQHMRYEEEVRLKAAQLADFLRRDVGSRADRVFLPPSSSPSDTGYRNRIGLHAAVDGDRVSLGYVAEDNRTVFDVPQCPLAMPPINQRLAELRADPEFMVSLRNRMTVSLRYTANDGVLMWKNDTGPGKERLTESTALGPIRAPRRSFFQVNPAVADMLVSGVTDLILERRPEAVVDLYCGVGIFALAAAKAGVPRVIGIDSDSKAIQAAGYNADKLGLTGTRFLAGSAEKLLDESLAGLPADRTLLIVDPPRRGLERQTLDRLAAVSPRSVVYVSCAPDTLARDVALLAKSGFQAVRSRVLDMFPRTAEFESVTVLEKATA